jgi:hypothetical protein
MRWPSPVWERRDGQAAALQAIRMGFHADMRDSPRLRAFIDFAVEEFELQAGALNPPP